MICKNCPPFLWGDIPVWWRGISIENGGELGNWRLESLRYKSLNQQDTNGHFTNEADQATATHVALKELAA